MTDVICCIIRYLKRVKLSAAKVDDNTNSIFINVW